ncbi:MAG: heme ABC exporter ATP-binding protein CcmA [Alphaproteobacteria bacterium]|nr:heme ABC exporter ATP-binding protein CcmA [Alphaproteobacteria bacterium]
MTDFSGRDLACMRGGRVVFAGLDFAVGAGGALLLTGPNGSGKSSLLRLMAGLGRPAAGALAWAGVPIAADPEAHAARLQFVGHLDAVKPALTVAENLGLWTRLGGGTGSVAAALAAVGLDRLAVTPARFLSAGQRRRLALARLWTRPASLWLLDEPTIALDPPSVAAVEAAIARHRAAGGIAIVSSNVAIGLPAAAVVALERFAEAP